MGRQVFSKTISSDPDLLKDFFEVESFTWNFTITEKSTIKAFGHVDCRHRGVYIPDKAVMVSLKLMLDGKWLEGSKTGANIINETDHYQPLMVHGFAELEPGDHSISVWMRSASTALPDRDGIAEIKGTFNQVVYEVEPI